MEEPNDKKELAEILLSIRDMIDKDKKFFAAQRLADAQKPTTGQGVIELSSMIDENGKVVELPLLKKRDGLETKMENPPSKGQFEPDIKQQLEEVTAPGKQQEQQQGQQQEQQGQQGQGTPPNAEELVKMLTKDIFREWVATELPQLAKKVIRAELVRIRLAKDDPKGVDK